MRATWRRILETHTRVMLDPPGPQQWHLRVDWSTEARGYALWAGAPQDGVLVGIGSSRHKLPTSSMLGKLHTVIWALKETTELTKGTKIIVETDLESAKRRLARPPTGEAIKDVRVLRSLAWMVANFGPRLEIAFLPGEDNQLADLLSRWRDLGAETSDPTSAAVHVAETETGTTEASACWSLERGKDVEAPAARWSPLGDGEARSSTVRVGM